MSELENNNQRDGDNVPETDNTKEEPTKVPHQRITLCLLSAVFFTCNSSFLYGYNLSVVNAAAPHAKSLINNTWIERYGTPVTPETATLLWSVTISIMSIGGLLGSILAKFLLKVLGRRSTLITNNIFSLVAAVLLSSGEKAHSFVMLIIGRFIIGLYAGISLSSRFIYMAEISPKHIRGSITLASSIMSSLGVFAGQIMGLKEVFGQESRWIFLFAVIAIPALVQIGGLFFMPESPRYLLIEKNDEAGAEKAFRRFLGKEDVTAELEEVQVERHNNLQVLSVLQVLRDRTVRWQLITGIIIVACLELSGVLAVLFYTNIILTDAGVSGSTATYMTLSIGATQVIFSSCSRTVSWMPFLSFAFILAVFAFAAVGPDSVAFVLVSELFEQSRRPAAFLICGCLSWLGQFTIGLVFPFMQEALQSYVFLVFLVVCTGAAVYLFFILPETKNKTFVEISQSFAQRNKLSTARPNRQEQTISSVTAAA
ncbi:solute carrier family 2, facilitated glucose transporter member 9-like isoform X2 [Genypterus blacodes]|uniref:solute carrier family 2, facilitated glucose transporter member 9-like isoform X2 n=1 Tax=Genypterus blacodes TaxID=154954 RepID=UPI003F76FEA4